MRERREFKARHGDVDQKEQKKTKHHGELTLFDDVGQHDNGLDAVLPDHLPELSDSLVGRALSGYVLIFATVGAAHVVGVDIVVANFLDVWLLRLLDVAKCPHRLLERDLSAV